MDAPGVPAGAGFEISVEDDYVLARADPGRVLSAERVVSALQELFSLVAYRSEKTADIWDLRRCETDLRYDSVEKISQFMHANYDASWSHRFTAIVADTEVMYGMARMYEALIARIPIEIEVFREMEQAQAWLRAKLAEAAAEAFRGDVG